VSAGPGGVNPAGTTAGASGSPAAGRPGGARWTAGLGGVPRALASVGEAIADLQRQQVALRQATVVANAGSSCSILLADTQIDGVPMLRTGYTLVIGDIVQVLQTRGQLLVLGRPV
jgi:hypothetical protein